MKRSACIIIMILLLLLNACNSDITDTKTTVQTLQTETVLSETASSYDTELETEGAETAPFVPYTLKHTTTDLSDKLPSRIPNINAWDEYALKRSTFLHGNTLYVFNRYDESGERNATLYHYTVGENGIEAGRTTVPKIREDDDPYYVYPLDGGRLVLFYCTQDENYYYHSSFVVIEADGTVLAEVDFSEDYRYRYTYVMMEFFVDEDEEHNVMILLDMLESGTGKLMAYQFHNEDNSVTLERTVYHNNDIAAFRLMGACRTGETTYMYPNTDGYAVLNLKSGLVQQKELRLPQESELMWKLVDENEQIYLYDTLGLYQYNGSDAPTRLVEWEKCNFAHSGSIYNGQIFVMDANTIFYKIAISKNNETQNYLYCIQTESVPETDTRTVIRYNCYSDGDWYLNAVSAFNQTNEKYRVDLNLVDTGTMSRDDVAAHLAERLLSPAKPDMFTMNLRYLSLDTYYDKKAFLDLTPYIGDTLLGCITEALSWNGSLYAAPLGMSFQTFVCSDELETDFLTWSEFYGYINSLAEGEDLTTEDDAQSIIFANGLMDFFDRDAKTASYDTDTFRRMVQYTSTMNDYVNENDGRLVYNADGTYGYSNTTLPARIADGGVKFINIQIDTVERLVGLKLLFGDEGYTWCGYPSNEGGGAELNLANRTCILADSDAAAGCVEFLEFLLSDEWQTNDTHYKLPVTKTGIRSLLAGVTYNYYRTETYNAIGDPSATLKMPSLVLPGKPADGYISLSPEYTSATPIDTTQTDTGYVTSYQTVELTDAEKESFLAFLNNCHMKSGTDTTVQTIVEEELSYWENGVRTLEETTKIIQSRVWIYLNE